VKSKAKRPAAGSRKTSWFMEAINHPN